MKDILYDYQMTATTWVYLSSLIMISVYFKFRRFWSVRNLDIIGLIFFAPGLLMVAYGKESKVVAARHAVSEARTLTPDSPEGGARPADSGSGRAKAESSGEKPADQAATGRQIERFGYFWLFIVSLFFLLRLLVDPAMVRRPLLEPNLSASGLTFACAAMLVFLMSNVITDHLETKSPPAVRQNEHDAGEKPHDKPADGKDDGSQGADVRAILKQRGPGYPAFLVFSSMSDTAAARTTAIVAHLAIVLGLVLIGYRHFDNTHTGIAAATLYLLLPYTAEYTPWIDHVVPGALLIWGIQCYRRPAFAGIFVGLAAGLTWYPLFLLPLWCSFYWRRGMIRFSVAVTIMLVLLIASLAFMPPSLGTFWEQFLRTIGAPSIHVGSRDIRGFWQPFPPFRWPVFALFVAMCGSMVLWPAQKNLGTLLACSAAIMLGTQFWKAYDGGTYMAWYLPLMILTILRPNLEDRVALSAISEGWVKWRK
jgi:hypothetical protein